MTESSATSSVFFEDEPTECKLRGKRLPMDKDFLKRPSFRRSSESSSNSSFSVTTGSFSVENNRKLLDEKGTELYKMSDAMWLFRGYTSILNAKTNEPIVSLQKVGGSPIFGPGTILVFRGARWKGKPWIRVSGNILKKNYVLEHTKTGRVIASVKKRSHSFRNIFERDSYVIKVEAGYDAAFMIFLVVAIGQHYQNCTQRKKR